MQDWIHELYRDSNNILVELNKKECLDIEIFQRMANDCFCLQCVLQDKEKARILYSIQNKVSLHDFISQYVFEKEEGYQFLIHLMESAIAINRNKPVYFHPKAIFLDEHGENFYFMVIPISLQEWMFTTDQIKEWIEYLYKNIQTTTAFEIPGYLIRFLNCKEFSLPNLILGLKNLQQLYHPKRFSFLKKKKEPSFRVQEAIHPLYIEEIKEEVSDNHTRILGMTMEEKAYVEIHHKMYELSETTLIGRSFGCDIQLKEEEVSLTHCKIVCENHRYYIQDLKSSNGTFLNGKRVQRKMRLKDGMEIQIANVKFVFHQ